MCRSHILIRIADFLEAGDAEGHRKNCELLWEVLGNITEAVGRERAVAAAQEALAMLNLRAVMTKAWAIFRSMRDRMSFAAALRCAWAWVRGKRFAYETSYVDSAYRVIRTIGFSETYDGVRAARIAEHWEFLAVGLRPLGSNEFNLSAYAAV